MKLAIKHCRLSTLGDPNVFELDLYSIFQGDEIGSEMDVQLASSNVQTGFEQSFVYAKHAWTHVPEQYSSVAQYTVRLQSKPVSRFEC